MLPRISRFSRKHSLATTSRQSTRHAQYHSKVRALPFRLTPDKALDVLAPAVSVAVHNNPWDLPKVLVSDLPWSASKQSSPPKRFQPIYFPAWMLLGFMETGPPHPTFLSVDGSQIPGFSYDPLTRMTFCDPNHEDFQPVPFTDDLRRQHNMDVLCLPYQFTPLNLPQYLRRHPPKQEPLSRLDLTLTRTRAVACPVLLPVYLAEYEGNFNGIHTEATFAIGAFGGNSVVWIDNSHRLAVFTELLSNSSFWGSKYLIPFLGGQIMTYNDPLPMVTQTQVHEETTEIAKQLEMVATFHGTWAHYRKFWEGLQKKRRSIGDADFDDPRIREWPAVEERFKYHLDGATESIRTTLIRRLQAGMEVDSLTTPIVNPHIPDAQCWITTLLADDEDQPDAVEAENQPSAYSVTLTLQEDEMELANLRTPFYITAVYKSSTVAFVRVDVKPPPPSDDSLPQSPEPESNTEAGNSETGESQPPKKDEQGKRKVLTATIDLTGAGDPQAANIAMVLLGNALGSPGPQNWVSKWKEEEEGPRTSTTSAS